MNKRKARRLIKELQDEVNPETVVQQFWMDKVQMYVQLIFGDAKDSVALPMFGTYYWDRYYQKTSAENSEKARQVAAKLKDLFTTYQKAINNNVFLRRNIFSDDTNGTIVAWLIFGAGIIWLIAFNEGQRSANVEDDTQKREIVTLRDSLRVMKANSLK